MKELNVVIRERKTTSGFVFSHAITMLFGPIRSEMSSRAERGGGGQALRHAAFARHDVDLGVAVVLRSEGELRAIRREARKRAVTRAAGEPPRGAAVLGHGVKFAGVTENDLPVVDGRKPKQPRRVRQILPEGGSVDHEQEHGHEQESKRRDDAHKKN